MAVNKIILQYPSEAIRVSVENYINSDDEIILPNRGDYTIYKGKEYKVGYRIFDPDKKIVTIVFEELFSDNN